jgi:hypothetical protein
VFVHLLRTRGLNILLSYLTQILLILQLDRFGPLVCCPPYELSQLSSVLVTLPKLVTISNISWDLMNSQAPLASAQDKAAAAAPKTEIENSHDDIIPMWKEHCNKALLSEFMSYSTYYVYIFSYSLLVGATCYINRERIFVLNRLVASRLKSLKSTSSSSTLYTTDQNNLYTT